MASYDHNAKTTVFMVASICPRACWQGVCRRLWLLGQGHLWWRTGGEDQGGKRRVLHFSYTLLVVPVFVMAVGSRK